MTMESSIVIAPPPAGGARIVRFVALGDSLTVGLGDPMPDGSWRGWASLLAGGLADAGEVRFHNLARTGARAVDVADRQLAAALQLRPHVASVIVGVNDTLRDGFDPRPIGVALHRAVGTLHASGAVVLTARLPDPGRMLRLPASLARPLSRRMRAVNALADAVATRFGTCHVDFADEESSYDRRMWGIDRLHPSERGHRLFAGRLFDGLATHGFPVRQRPAAEPTNPVPTRRDRAWWLATQGTAWLMRRSTDLIPSLLAMAAAGWWQDARGLAARVDERLAQDIADALTQLDDSVAAA